MPDQTQTDAIQRHIDALLPVADTPLNPGNRVTLLDEAMTALRAMWDAIRSAHRTILIEMYTLEDIVIDGTRLGDLLRDRLAAGVLVAIVYDAIGSSGTPDAFFDDLRRAGARIMPFRSLKPWRRGFSWRFDDRDHRKIVVVDDRVAFLGGVNIDAQYLNPPANRIPPDGNTKKAFWQDAAARFEGPSVADTRDLFLHTWTRHGGERLPIHVPADRDPHPPGDGADERVCVEGSAPHEGRPLHIRALAAALGAARSRVWVASGYFVPMPDEIRALEATARRGVDIRLVLPGVSDVPGVVHAARATYGRLLRAGIRIHEKRDAVLHAKVATVDGVWTSIGSSNYDRRSAVLNNEVDAVVIEPSTAQAVETMMRGWFDDAHEVTLAAGGRARPTSISASCLPSAGSA